MVLAHVLQSALGPPAQQLVREPRVGIAAGDVAGTPRGDGVGDVASRGTAEALQHLQDAVAPSRAEVHGMATRVRAEIVQRGKVAVRQIHHVNVVAHARSVRRVIIRPEHAQRFALPAGDLRDVWHKVVGHAARVLPDLSAGMRAARVEVAQQGHAHGRSRRADVAQHILDHQLGAAIGVGGAERVVFRQRQELRVAVDGGR